jgi:hypothetical protein
MNMKKHLQLAALLDRFAELVDAIGEREFAALYRDHAQALRVLSDQAEAKSIGTDIVASLRVGPGTLADRYLIHADGTPDVERSREYVVLVDDIRRRAKHIP